MNFSKIAQKAGLAAIENLTKSDDGQKQLLVMLETSVPGGRAVSYDHQENGCFFTHLGSAKYDGILGIENDMLPMKDYKEGLTILLGSLIGSTVCGFIDTTKFNHLFTWLRSLEWLDGFFLHIENEKSFLAVYRIGYPNSPIIYDREKLLGYVSTFFAGDFSQFMKENGAEVMQQVGDKMTGE